MIHNRDEFGNETIMQINIDMFTLQIYAIFMCKGTVKEKANYFADLILGPSNINDGDIVCNSSRMKTAF